jgi:hypothetical protein
MFCLKGWQAHQLQIDGFCSIPLGSWMAVECNHVVRFEQYFWVGKLGWLHLLAIRTELDVFHGSVAQLTYRACLSTVRNSWQAHESIHILP